MKCAGCGEDFSDVNAAIIHGERDELAKAIQRLQSQLDAANLQNQEYRKALEQISSLAIEFSDCDQEKCPAGSLQRTAQRAIMEKPKSEPQTDGAGRAYGEVCEGCGLLVLISCTCIKRKCDMTGPCEDGHVCGEGQERILCYLAEVDQPSKESCGACKDVDWKGRWYSNKGNSLTNDPHEAKRFKNRQECLEFCSLVRHSFHLYPTEHMFYS